jgi:hypothetical protein
MSPDVSYTSPAASNRYGLCARCIHAHKIVSAKESVFILCLYSKIDSIYTKYPQIPVTQCNAYKEKQQK